MTAAADTLTHIDASSLRKLDIWKWRYPKNLPKMSEKTLRLASIDFLIHYKTCVSKFVHYVIWLILFFSSAKRCLYVEQFVDS
jgi:hypothetical protein